MVANGESSTKASMRGSRAAVRMAVDAPMEKAITAIRFPGWDRATQSSAAVRSACS